MRMQLTVGAALALAAGCGEHGGAMKAPSDLTATAANGGAHLMWKDNSDNESAFMIERQAGSALWAVLAQVPANTADYHDAPLTAGTTYKYRVMAMGKAGHSDGSGFSNEAMFVAPAAGTPNLDGGAGQDSGPAGGDLDSGDTPVHDAGHADQATDTTIRQDVPGHHT